MTDKVSTKDTDVQTVCLLLGNRKVPEYFFNAVECMIETTGVEVTLVIEAVTPENEDKSIGLRSFVENKGPIDTLESMFKYEHPLVDITESEYVPTAALRTAPIKPTTDVGVCFPEAVIETVAESCDVGIHLRVGIIKGEILNAPSWGVIGYHHGDLREYRGAGYGFWEFMNDEKTAGVTIQILTEDLDAGSILHFREVDISSATSFKQTRRMLVEASVPMLAEGIQNLQDPEFVPEVVPERELGEMYYSSDMTRWVKIRYLLKHARQNLSRLTQISR
jgi:hypothetical protein